ncbi:uncharacterized protein N7515_009634 [Penicillium bovifimosum]|uniref:GH18 domain-containing protein n=1 Tax=Penicillium bovifimosum TaxID=126998 RepID=A0A9W9KW09_9EURO|nr:uncharacterized protein N7515_009634 [Penicillium bovifimosum]KAJ5121673.1 hypothetical protein N7515_009634 [Penicillium bovifimosum]
MSYDLHGQWDYGNQYPDPGCKSGACLRSHVNLTETTSALSMITKAGVPGSKVVVGMASYGRSFEMAEASCTGPNCKYTGPDSGATPGRCTNTAGYIANAELNEIIDTNDSAEKSFDKGSDSNILVYNKTQWVAYMDDTTKDSRTSYYKGLNLGGTVDWAVDLQSFTGDSAGSGGGSSLDQQIFYVDPSVWEDDKPAMNCEAPCVLVLPPWPLSPSAVYHRPVHTTTLDVAWTTTIDVTGTDGDVTPTTTITRILQQTSIQGPAVTLTELPMANVNITVPINGTSNLTFVPIPRLPEQVVTITDDPNPLSQSGVTHSPVTRSVTLPPWPHITNLYVPDDVDDGKDTDDDDDTDDENTGSDSDDDQFPKIPEVVVTHGKGGSILWRRWRQLERGGSSSPNPDFPDPIDPDPPPADPNDPDETENDDPDDDDDDDDDHTTTSCSASTVTDFWVSCATGGTSSVSCTTTSSMVEVGCDITAVTSTTGVPVCYSFDQYEDQGQDGAPDAMSSVSLTPVSNTATTTSDSSSTTSGSDSGGGGGGGGGGGSDPTSTTSTSTPTATAALMIALGDDASSLNPNE